MKYVVLVREPLPDDMLEVATKVASGFRIPVDKAEKLLTRAPGPVTRPVQEREARTVQSIMEAAGLVVEVREEDQDGPLAAFSTSERDRPATGPAVSIDPSSTAVLARSESDVPAYSDGPDAAGTGFSGAGAAGAGVGAAGATDVSVVTSGEGRAWRTADRHPDPAPENQDARFGRSTRHDANQDPVQSADQARSTDPALGAAGERSADTVEARSTGAGGETDARRGSDGRESDRFHATPVPGHTTTTPPRDPLRTTLVREPPVLERGALRRGVASAATLPGVVTLIVTLLAICITVLPILRNAEQKRVVGVVDAFATTVEGMSGGLPLAAPIVRVELGVVQAGGAGAPGWGLDYLLLVDTDQTPLVAWYDGVEGVDAFPPEVLDAALAEARSLLAGGEGPERGSSTDWLANLADSGRSLLALVGLGSENDVVAGTQVRRGGAPAAAVAGAVVAGARPDSLRLVGNALLTALLVGLVPVLFGVLAALSLTRGLRDSIRYLLVATDRISHGDLEQPVELKRDDELGQIAKAVERMRISLHESLERLRQRR